ncbi:MAG: hypothetical protein RBU45_02810 [Myxococcota bacterium]|jgi:hypothetical protein|nr:hypothetical protein [Myxococcota bacterium]
MDSLLWTAALLLVTQSPAALPCPRVAPGGLQVDGFFADWQDIAGVRGAAGADLAWELRMARDDTRLYVIFGAQDDAFVPTPAAGGPGGDGFTLLFGSPTPGADLPSLTVLPGDLEDRPPRAVWRPRPGVPPADLPVDGATRPGGGWILELAVPLATLPWERGGPQGLEVLLEVRDVDPASGDGADGRGHYHLTFPEEGLTLGLLLQQLGLPPTTRPAHELRAQVGGDARPERALLFDRGVLAILGEGLGDGDFYTHELPFGDRARPLELTSTDLTGDGRDELLVRYRVVEQRGEDQHEQEFLSIFQYEGNDLRSLFAIELVHRGPRGQLVTNELTLGPPDRQGRRDLRVALGPCANVDLHEYQDVDAEYDNWYEELLLPWSPRRQAIYRYRDGRYLRSAAPAHPPAAARPKRPAKATLR